MKILTIVPAHNEEPTLDSCINGIRNQTIETDILVVCDNCTDNTEQLAQSLEVNTLKTINNVHKKSGALNQALDKYLLDYDLILVQDADTIIDHRLLENAVKEINKDKKLGAVCSKAGIKDIMSSKWSELLWWHLQRIEYATFDSSRIETAGSIKVVHGMAAVYRTAALQQVKNKWGRIYDENNITEDYELTICLKELGWKTTACMDMRAWTEVPVTLKELWKQRVRWFRGGIDVLRTHGINKITITEYIQHMLFIILTVLNVIIIYYLSVVLISGGQLSIHPLFYLVMIIVTLDGLYRLRYAENVKTIEIVIRLAILPFSIYMMLYQAQQLWAYWLSITNAKNEW